MLTSEFMCGGRYKDVIADVLGVDEPVDVLDLAREDLLDAGLKVVQVGGGCDCRVGAVAITCVCVVTIVR